MTARVEPENARESLVDAFERNLSEAYRCLDLPARFKNEGTIFRIGWGDHIAGRPCPQSSIHASRGWMERESMKRRETPDV